MSHITVLRVRKVLSGPPCTHARVDNLGSVLQAAGIPESLVRLSVGIEDTDDLLQDIQQALQAVS